MTSREMVRLFFEYVPRLNHLILRDTMKPEMPHQQFRLLHMLAHHNMEPMKIFSDKMHVSKPNMTKLVDQMIEQGFVERSHSKEDRRVILLGITDAGKERLAVEFEGMVDRGEELFSSITDQEREAFIENLQGIVTIMEKLKKEDRRRKEAQ